jgi:hypothetical protein
LEPEAWAPRRAATGVAVRTGGAVRRGSLATRATGAGATAVISDEFPAISRAAWRMRISGSIFPTGTAIRNSPMVIWATPPETAMWVLMTWESDWAMCEVSRFVRQKWPGICAPVIATCPALHGNDVRLTPIIHGSDTLHKALCTRKRDDRFAA